MNLLKKKDLVSVNIIKSNSRKKCTHCTLDIITGRHVAAFEFSTKISKIYTHFACKDAYNETLR